jgi:hypothetical protein
VTKGLERSSAVARQYRYHHEILSSNHHHHHHGSIIDSPSLQPRRRRIQLQQYYEWARMDFGCLPSARAEGELHRTLFSPPNGGRRRRLVLFIYCINCYCCCYYETLSPLISHCSHIYYINVMYPHCASAITSSCYYYFRTIFMNSHPKMSVQMADRTLHLVPSLYCILYSLAIRMDRPWLHLVEIVAVVVPLPLAAAQFAPWKPPV